MLPSVGDGLEVIQRALLFHLTFGAFGNSAFLGSYKLSIWHLFTILNYLGLSLDAARATDLVPLLVPTNLNWNIYSTVVRFQVLH